MYNRITTFYCKLLIPIIVLFNIGCSYYTPSADFVPTESFRKLVLKMDSIKNTENEVVSKRYFDSVVQNGFHMNVGDSFEYYGIFFNYYNWVVHNSDSAERYLGLMEKVLYNHKARPASKEYAQLLSQYYYQKGSYHFMIGDYEQTYQYYYKGRTMGVQYVDQCMLQMYNHRLGLILFSKSKFEEALIYFKRSMENKENCDSLTDESLFTQQELYANLGLCYDRLNQYDSAIYWYQAALEFQEKNINGKVAFQDSYFAAKGVALSNMGHTYLKLEQYELADSILNESYRALLKTKSEQFFREYTLLRLAKNQLNAQNYPKAKNYLDQLSELIATQHNPNIYTLHKFNHYWSIYYAQYKNDYRQAYEYLTVYASLLDTIRIQEFDLLNSDIKEHLRSIEKQDEIHMLEQSNVKKTWLLLGSSIILILSLLAIGLTYYYMRRMKRYVQLLGKLNSDIRNQKGELKHALRSLQQSNQEKDKILRVVAHDLRSPIAAIYALTELLLSEEDLDEEKKESLELIKGASNQALTLSREILNSSDLIENKALDYQSFNLNKELITQIDLLRFKAGEKSRRFP